MANDLKSPDRISLVSASKRGGAQQGTYDITIDGKAYRASKMSNERTVSLYNAQTMRKLSESQNPQLFLRAAEMIRELTGA